MRYPAPRVARKTASGRVKSKITFAESKIPIFLRTARIKPLSSALKIILYPQAILLAVYIKMGLASGVSIKMHCLAVNGPIFI